MQSRSGAAQMRKLRRIAPRNCRLQCRGPPRSSARSDRDDTRSHSPRQTVIRLSPQSPHSGRRAPQHRRPTSAGEASIQPKDSCRPRHLNIAAPARRWTARQSAPGTGRLLPRGSDQVHQPAQRAPARPGSSPDRSRRCKHCAATRLRYANPLACPKPRRAAPPLPLFSSRLARSEVSAGPRRPIRSTVGLTPRGDCGGSEFGNQEDQHDNSPRSGRVK